MTTITKERRGEMPEVSIDFGDMKTRFQRNGWYVNKFLYWARVIMFVAGFVLLLLSGITALENKQLADKQYANLIKYGNETGFQAVLHR